MKAWWQVMSPVEKRPGFKNTLMEYVHTIASPDSQFEMHGTHTNLRGEEFRAIFQLDVRRVYGNAVMAERTGFDAFIVGNALDAGLQEVRQLVDIPVISFFETCLHTMAMMGRNFAIISPHRQFIPIWLDLVQAHGFSDRLVSISDIGMRPVDLESAYTDPNYEERQIEACVETARKAVAAGAEIVLPLPSSWYLRLVKRGITEVDGAPLFNGIAATVKMTELMVRYKEVTGSCISRKLTYAQPPKEMIAEAFDRNHIDIG